MEEKSYKTVGKQLQFIIKNDMFTKKQIEETMEKIRVMNNANTYVYMQAAVNVMFIKIHANK